MQQNNRVTPMDRTTEKELVKLAQQGNKKAYEKLFKQWLPFMYSVILKTKLKVNISDYIDDMVQECSLGFDMAIKKFDASKNKRFSTYYYHWIKRALFDFERSHTVLHHYPLGRMTQINQLEKAQKNLLHQLDREPTIAELSKYTGWSIRVVKNVQKYMFKNNVVSLDYISNTGIKAEELIPSENEDIDANLELEIMQSKIKRILAEMKPKEAYTLSALYGLNGYEPRTAVQLTRELGTSDKMVYKRTKTALERFETLARKYKLDLFVI